MRVLVHILPPILTALCMGLVSCSPVVTSPPPAPSPPPSPPASPLAPTPITPPTPVAPIIPVSLSAYARDFTALATSSNPTVTVQGASAPIGIRVLPPVIASTVTFQPSSECAAFSSLQRCFQDRINKLGSNTRLIVTQGVYKFGPTGDDPETGFLELRSKTDVEINFSHSLLLFGQARDGIRVLSGNRVRLMHAQLGWSIPVQARGKITSATTMEVQQPNPDTPISLDAPIIGITGFDFAASTWKDNGAGFNTRNTPSGLTPSLSGSTITYSSSTPLLANFVSKGNTDVVVRYYGRRHAVVVEADPQQPQQASNDITFDHIKIYSSPYMGFKITMQYGSGLLINSCSVTPLRAGKFVDGSVNPNTFISSNIDAINIENASDIIVQNTNLSHMGDDGINMHTLFGQVASTGDKTIQLSGGFPANRDAKNIVLFSENLEYLGQVPLQSVNGRTLTLGAALPGGVQAGAYLAGRERFASRYWIDRNTISEGLSRGLLLFIPNGAVTSNTISRMQSAGISLRQEATSNNRLDDAGRFGSGVNLRLQGNTIKATRSKSGPSGDVTGLGAISFAASLPAAGGGVRIPDFGIFSNIVIAENTFFDVENAFDVSVTSGDDVTLQGNTYSRASGAVSLQKSSEVFDCPLGVTTPNAQQCARIN